MPDSLIVSFCMCAFHFKIKLVDLFLARPFIGRFLRSRFAEHFAADFLEFSTGAEVSVAFVVVSGAVGFAA